MSDESQAGWHHPLPLEGSAYPENLVAMVWSYFQWDLGHERNEWAYPRSEQQLRTLINSAYQAGLHTEEERPVRFQVVFDLKPSQVTVAFDRPFPYTVGRLIKLSPTIGIGVRWLVVTPREAGSDPLKIVGICDPYLSPHPTSASLVTRWVAGMGFNVPEVSGIAVSVFGPGWMRISTWAQRHFELRDCSIRLPFTLHEIPVVQSWYEHATACLGASDATIAAALIRRVWGTIISKVRDAHHGGCFIVVPDEVDVKELPIRFLSPLSSTRLRDVIRARMAIEPELSQHAQGRADIELGKLDEAHFLERDVSRIVDLFASLAAVDGAVVLHRDLGVLGFGAEIVNPVTPSEEERVALDERYALSGRRDKPLASFGMRHRSAYRFVEQVEGALAFVVSQDGDVRLFANSGGKVRLYEGPGPEDRIIFR